MNTGMPVPGYRLAMARELGCFGMTKGKFADRVGIARGSVDNYESGKTPIKRPALWAWAQVTGYRLEWFTSTSEVDFVAHSNAVQIKKIRAIRGLTDKDKEALIAKQFPQADIDPPPVAGRRITG